MLPYECKQASFIMPETWLDHCEVGVESLLHHCYIIVRPLLDHSKGIGNSCEQRAWPVVLMDRLRWSHCRLLPKRHACDYGEME